MLMGSYLLMGSFFGSKTLRLHLPQQTLSDFILKPEFSKRRKVGSQFEGFNIGEVKKFSGKSWSITCVLGIREFATFLASLAAWAFAEEAKQQRKTKCNYFSLKNQRKELFLIDQKCRKTQFLSAFRGACKHCNGWRKIIKFKEISENTLFSGRFDVSSLFDGFNCCWWVETLMRHPWKFNFFEKFGTVRFIKKIW